MSPAIDTARAEACNAAMKRVTAFAVLLVVLAAPAWAGWDEAAAAYDRGDYATALREFRPPAERGYAKAQYYLGRMYEYGQAPTSAFGYKAKFDQAVEIGRFELVSGPSHWIPSCAPASISGERAMRRA